MSTASEVPDIEIVHLQTPSAFTPGVGEQVTGVRVAGGLLIVVGPVLMTR